MTEGYFKVLAEYAAQRPEELRQERQYRDTQRIYEQAREKRRATYERWGNLTERLEDARMERLERQIVGLIGKHHWDWLISVLRDDWNDDDYR